LNLIGTIKPLDKKRKKNRKKRKRSLANIIKGVKISDEDLMVWDVPQT
jgi:hypothetical protein